MGLSNRARAHEMLPVENGENGRSGFDAAVEHELPDGVEGGAQNAPRLLVVVCVGGSHDETGGAGPAELSVDDQAVAVDVDVG